MARMDPSAVIEALRILTTSSTVPQSAHTDCKNSSRFDQLLVNNTKLFDSKLDTDPRFLAVHERWKRDTEVILPPENSPRWRFVCYCLKGLHILQRCLRESVEDYKNMQHEGVKPTGAPQMSPDTLSFGEQKVIRTVFQFIVCLGICQNLHQGVGIPLQLRSGFSELVKMSATDVCVSDTEKQLQLFMCVKVLISCVFSTALGTLILTQHLTDILAGLLQLTHMERSIDTGRLNVSNGEKDSKKFNSENKTSEEACAESLPGNNDKKENLKFEDEKKKDMEDIKFQEMTPASIVDFVKSKFTNLPSLDKNVDTKTNICKQQSLTTESMQTVLKNNNHINTADTVTPGIEVKGKCVKVEDCQQNVYLDVDYCEKVFEDLMEKVYPPLLVKTLLLLQGGPRTKKAPGSKSLLEPAPNWLRRECGRRLTSIVMRPRGVQSVLRGMLDSPGAGRGMTEAADWRKCDAVAKVIACCPNKSQSTELYYKNVGPQILEILHIEDKQVCRQFLRVACSTISSMFSQHPGLTRDYVIQPMLKPLLVCLEERDISGYSNVVVDDQQLCICVEDCHKVFVCGSTDNPKLITSLQSVIHTLYQLLLFTKKGVSSLRSACQEIIVTYLKNTETSVTLTCLETLAFQQATAKSVVKFPRMHSDLKYANSSNGGVTVIKSDSGGDSSYQDINVESICGILKDLQTSGIAGEFLVHMLQELTSFIQCETVGLPTVYKKGACDGSTTDHMQASEQVTDDQVLIDIEQRNQSKVEQFHRKLTLLNLLATVCEQLGPSCIKNAKNTLDFVKATLERGVQVCKSTDDVMMEMFESETLTMAMGLLTAVLTGAFELTDDDKVYMEELLPLLQEISTHHPESSVQEMATDIRIAIATHGAIWSEVMKEKRQKYTDASKKVEKRKDTMKKTKPSIEVVDNSPGVKRKVKVKENASMPLVEKMSEADQVAENDSVKIIDKNCDINDEVIASRAKSDIHVINKTENIGMEEDLGKKEPNPFNMEDDAKKHTGKVTVPGRGPVSKEKENIKQTEAHFKQCDGQHGAIHNEKKEIDSQDGNALSDENQSTSNKDGNSLGSELEIAFKELCDPLVPVRGHGLIRLTRLVQRRDPEAFQRKDALFKIFEENLDHTDSYMYLSAVNGLSAMCDVFPSFVVPKICEQFANFQQSQNSHYGKRSPELRMKLGEILVKASRSLGDTIPQYRDLLVSSVLVGVKDEDPYVRASSLSNLGDICKLLKFSLGSVVHEVFNCCSSVLGHDEDAQVRKAAAQALTLLLQGMGSDVFKILDVLLKDLYRLLKQSMIAEKDDGVKLHVQLALTELDDLMRQQLFPQQKLEKRIRVLDYE